ncbi:MAG: hypothetical protein AABX61_00885 [Nanoarchaeota archaeon]
MEKNEILRRLNELRNEINSLRDRLNKVDREKESWFNKKESLKKDISKFVREIKETKKTKDNANVEVKQLRDSRDNYNKKVKELISKIKVLNKTKLDFIKKNKIKEDPDNIKKRIDALDFKIETEILSMDKEKSIMKQIKSLKKFYNQNIELKKIIDEINKIDKEINDNKTKSDEIHKKIKSIISISDPDYSKFKGQSIKINDLRKEQQNAFDKFIEFKKEFLKINEGLQNKLKESSNIKQQLDEINNKMSVNRQDKRETDLKERERIVEEKLLTKKKLTKDDLILLQR